MDSPRETLRALLAQYRKDRQVEKRTIVETMELLGKVDTRRRENPQDRRRWDTRANDLEEGLLESKRRLGWLDQHVLEAVRKLEALDASDGSDGVGDASSDTTVQEFVEEEVASGGSKGSSLSDLLSPQQAAAVRILDLPLFKVKDAPLEDFALAKLFRDSDAATVLGRKKTEELIKRIGIYDRSTDSSRRSERKGPTQEERRHQMLIRRALDKCRNNQMGALTLDDIDLLIGCYDLLMQGTNSADEGDRLLELVNRAIDHICTSWSKLERLREAMGVREID